MTNNIIIFEIFTWFVSILSITGYILNIQKKVYCFYFWIVANICWIGIDLYKGVYAQAAVFLFYSLICIYGIKKWKSETINVKERVV